MLESQQGRACWVQKENRTERRALELGDRNDMFIVVKSGLLEGENVVLDPLANVEAAQIEAARTLDETEPQKLKTTDI